MKILYKILFVLLLFQHLSSYSQKKNYTAVKLEGEKILIDGMIDEKAWDKAEWGGDFYQIVPHDKGKPTQPTRFKILYDDDNLYVAIEALDTHPDSIENRMTRRDENEGDHMGIAFDSYHDLRTAFVFVVNSAGVKADAAVSEDGNNWDYNWDPIWYVKTRINSTGWVAEMKIPLTQLRFGKQDEYIWGLQVARYYFRNSEDNSWQYISNNASGWVSFFGELHGIKGIKPKKQKEIVPYVVTSYEDYKPDKTNPFSTGHNTRLSAGVDGKFGVTNDLTLDFTVNPDFGQVEADPSVVNLSTFETFYQEKRPFFIEGKNIMNYSLTSGGELSSDNLFYSRRIGRPPHISPDTNDSIFVNSPQNSTILGAVKLTGKTKKGWSIGLLESMTKQESAEIDSFRKPITEVVEPFTNYFLARIQKDLNNTNTRIGCMFTATNRQINAPSLNTLNKSAYTGGIDFHQQWKNKTYFLDITNIFSHVEGSKEAILDLQTSEPRYFQRPDAPHLKVDSSKTSLTGFGGTLQTGRAGNSKWPYIFWVTWRSPSLELNDLGYLYTPDIIQQVFWVGYRNFTPFSIFRSFFLDFNQWSSFTSGKEYHYAGGNAYLSAGLKNFWYFSIGLSYNAKSYSTSELRGGPSLLIPPSFNISYYVITNNLKSIVLNAGANHTIQQNHYFIGHNVYAALSWRVSKALKISVSPNINYYKSTLAYVNNVYNPLSQSDRYIRASLDQVETYFTLRVNYNITPDFTIQYYGMPFVSVGDYSHYKYIVNSKASDYRNQYISYALGQISSVVSGENSTYWIDENRDGHSDYSFDNPDFNFFQYRSNLIARWEYSPGSTAYFVWSFSQDRYKNNGNYSFGRDMGEIFRLYPHSIFLIKVSYRFGI